MSQKFFVAAAVLVLVAVVCCMFNEGYFHRIKRDLTEEVDTEVHRLGQQLARETLYLARPYMFVSGREGVLPCTKKWGELRYRIDKMHDPCLPKVDWEPTFLVLREISYEHALGLFYKRNPNAGPAFFSDVFKEAENNPAWSWALGLEKKLDDLNTLVLEASNAQSYEELEEVRRGFETLRAEIVEAIKNGPPKSKQGVTIPNPLPTRI